MIRTEFSTKKEENFSLMTNECINPENGTFIFFHATGFNAFTYNQLFNSLNLKFNNKLKIIAMDQRGHGFSKANANPEELKSWDDFVEDALELVDSTEGPVICGGHSMGAVIAAKAASLRQNKVKKLIMIEPVLWSPFQALKYRFLSGINFKTVSIADGAAKRRFNFEGLDKAVDSYVGKGAFSTWDRQWIEDYLVGGTKERPGGGIELTCSPAWESATFRSSSMDTWKYLKKIEIPCYVPCGGYGSTFSDQARIALKKLGKNWELEYFEGSSHFLPMEFSETLIDRMHSFMSK